MKLRKVKTPIHCYRTLNEGLKLERRSLNLYPYMLSFHYHMDCHATATDMKVAWKMLKITLYMSIIIRSGKGKTFSIKNKNVKELKKQTKCKTTYLLLPSALSPKILLCVFLHPWLDYKGLKISMSCTYYVLKNFSTYEIFFKKQNIFQQPCYISQVLKHVILDYSNLFYLGHWCIFHFIMYIH